MLPICTSFQNFPPLYPPPPPLQEHNARLYRESEAVKEQARALKARVEEQLEGLAEHNKTLR